MPIDRQALSRALALAGRAPSPHNTQPWEVRLEGERLHLGVDPLRTLPHGDPHGRDLGLAMGAFVEALSIGLASEGLAARGFTGLEGGQGSMTLVAAPSTGRELASLLRRRQTSRLAYSPRAPDADALARLVDFARAQSLELHLVPRQSEEARVVRGWLLAASRESWLDARAVRELSRWIRFDPEGLRPPDDGLSTHVMNLGTAEALALLPLLKPGIWKLASALFVAPLLAEALAAPDGEAFDASPLLGILIAPGKAAERGAELLRVWLEATRLGLAMHPQSVLLDRRGWELGRHLGVDPQRLALAFRLGRSTPPPRSGRRAVERFADLGSP